MGEVGRRLIVVSYVFLLRRGHGVQFTSNISGQ